MTAIRSYILIKVEPGSSKQVIGALRKLKDVISADLVTGLYDAILVVEVTDMNEIAEFVVNKVSSTPGVASTVTCLALEVPN